MRRYTKDHNGTSVRHIEYDSIHDFFSSTDVKNPPANMHRGNKSDHQEVINRDSSWRYGDEDIRSTYHEVRFDPSKGRNMCADKVKTTMADATYKKLVRQAMSYKKKIKYQDHGFRINVSKAISGEDRYFADYKNSRKPIVKIAINVCGSCSVEQSAFRNVAQTAIPTIYALEAAGIPTEVYFCAFANGVHIDINRTITHVKIKSAQQRFSWTTFAPVFTLGSYRESVFLSWIYDEHEVNGGLGRPMNDSQISACNNFGYTAVIGLNAVGPVTQVNQIFDKLGKKDFAK